eukprot:3091150-Amphidinium_carterae.1
MFSGRLGSNQETTCKFGKEVGRQACGNAATQPERRQRTNQGRWQAIAGRVCWTVEAPGQLMPTQPALVTERMLKKHLAAAS